MTTKYNASKERTVTPVAGTDSTNKDYVDFWADWANLRNKPPVVAAGATQAAARSAIGAIQLSDVERPWSSEMMINAGALANGYNDFIGGALVDRDIILTHVVFRVADPAAVVGGTGNLTIDWYLGTATAAETTLVTTTTIAAGANNLISTLLTPQACSINSVLRAKITLGSASVAGPCHVQFRGRYA